MVGSEVREVAVYGRALTPSEVSGHHAGCVAIQGAAEEAYRVAADDLGLSLRVVVTGTDEGETRVTASGITQSVTARPPIALSPPSIVGTAEEGQVLNAANGTWDGTEPLELAHQWQRCDAQGEDCADIADASGPSYTVGPGDVEATIRLTVTARGLGGELIAFSEASEPVVEIPEPQARFKQHWPYVAGVASLLSSLEGQTSEPPTIAIVDSGIDSGRADFGGRVIEEVNLSTRQGNQPGDGYGHGTAVASVAAGEAEGYVGAAPEARLVAVEALDDDGVAYLSDVIDAADWIYLNRERLNIRVANFSLHGTTVASLASDPLDRAVERLWLSGIVVVTAAGNYAVDGEESLVPFAPGNDPFVLTVGATDTARVVHATGRRRCAVVGVGVHARRVREARAQRSRPVHRRSGVRGHDAVAYATGTDRRARLPPALGNLARGAGRRRHGRKPPGGSPRVDAGSGEGRAHAHRRAARPCEAAFHGRRHPERGQRCGRRRPAQSEPRASALPRSRSERRHDAGLRRRRLDDRRAVGPGLGERRLGLGGVGLRGLVERGLGVGGVGIGGLGVGGLGVRGLGLGCLGEQFRGRPATGRRLLGSQELTA